MIITEKDACYEGIIDRRSPAKINWWLRVLDKRPDGYHNIETVFQRLDLCDDMRGAYTINRPSASPPRLFLHGFPPGLRQEENLIYRAWQGFNALCDRPSNRSLSFEVGKKIPYGGGLGGGSSNAATALAMIAELTEETVDPARLHEMAGGLGADVPFFLSPHHLALGTGRGTDLEALPAPARPLSLILAIPPQGTPTAQAYRSLSGLSRTPPLPGQLDALIEALREGDVDGVARSMRNDFELVAGPDFLSLGQTVRAMGLPGVLLCGSGSTVAILQREPEAARNLLTLKTQHPSWEFIPATSCGPVHP